MAPQFDSRRAQKTNSNGLLRTNPTEQHNSSQSVRNRGHPSRNRGEIQSARGLIGE